MKDEKEINVSVAQLFGWSTCDKCEKWHDPINNLHDEPPNYFGDYNTRPEMLASLTEEEIFEVVKACKTTEGNWWSASDFAALMRLDQPSFARLYCKIKGIL